MGDALCQKHFWPTESSMSGAQTSVVWTVSVTPLHLNLPWDTCNQAPCKNTATKLVTWKKFGGEEEPDVEFKL